MVWRSSTPTGLPCVLSIFLVPLQQPLVFPFFLFIYSFSFIYLFIYLFILFIYFIYLFFSNNFPVAPKGLVQSIHSEHDVVHKVRLLYSFLPSPLPFPHPLPSSSRIPLFLLFLSLDLLREAMLFIPLLVKIGLLTPHWS